MTKRTMADLHRRMERFYPDVDAFVHDDVSLTYAAYAERSRRLASGLYKAGVRHQDRVAILAHNCIEYFEVYGACEWAGFITATINFRLRGDEIDHVLTDSKPSAVVFQTAFASIISEVRARHPEIRLWIEIGAEGRGWAADYSALLASGDGGGPPIVASPDDCACLIYTSGTTGRPKGVMRSQHALYRVAETTSPSLEMQLYDRALQNTPVFHIGGKCWQISAAYAGATVVLDRGFDAGRVIDAIARQKITHMFVVAPMLIDLLAHPALDQADLDSLRVVVTAAAPIPAALLRRAIRRMGSVFMSQYGMTESLATGLARREIDLDGPPHVARRVESVGHPLPGIDLKLVDDDGVECPTGRPGEVCVRSDSQLTGYWNDSAATIEALRNGWYHSGDIGYLDEAGYLYLVDRKKDMIISGGENIYSLEVENTVATHPAVAEVAIIGVPHSKWVETVKAVVVVKDGVAIDPDELIEYCRASIACYKCPTIVEVTDRLPYLPTGKIDKKALRAAHVATPAHSDEMTELS